MPLKTTINLIIFGFFISVSSVAYAVLDDSLDELDFMQVMSQVDNNDGSLGSEKPHIPEPMVFDLVRPLGVTKGELEMNSLMRYSRHGNFEWSPEIEYAVFDGFALEFELPFESLHLQEYKVGAQGTFGVFDNHHFIHGWQAIGYYDRVTHEYTGDLLYLNGYSTHTNWSIFNMMGIRISQHEKGVEPTGLLNNSVFYAFSERFTAGIELNNEFSHQNHWDYLVTPQLHVDMNQNVSLQLGPGYSSKKEWLAFWRLIYAF
jgi:hypothetical protein